jgi:hypothetical protein
MSERGVITIHFTEETPQIPQPQRTFSGNLSEVSGDVGKVFWCRGWRAGDASPTLFFCPLWLPEGVKLYLANSFFKVLWKINRLLSLFRRHSRTPFSTSIRWQNRQKSRYNRQKSRHYCQKSRHYDRFYLMPSLIKSISMAILARLPGEAWSNPAA